MIPRGTRLVWSEWFIIFSFRKVRGSNIIFYIFIIGYIHHMSSSTIGLLSILWFAAAGDTSLKNESAFYLSDALKVLLFEGGFLCVLNSDSPIEDCLASLDWFFLIVESNSYSIWFYDAYSSSIVSPFFMEFFTFYGDSAINYNYSILFMSSGSSSFSSSMSMTSLLSMN